MGSVKNDSCSNSQVKANGDIYGKVVLTLKNCLLPTEKFSPTPSQLDGLDLEIETDLRIMGCELIQTAGILLKMPQVAMATAQVLFHRFYFSKSFVRQNFEITGMGCLYLASKIEEAPRRIRDVVNVYHHIKQVNNQRTISPMLLDQNYITLKYQVIKAERRVLKELGFCVHVKHPHKLIVLYLQVLGLESKSMLMQVAWNYMNDSLRTDVFVRYQPEVVACACIYLTARRLKIVLPKQPAWYSIFRVEEKDIQDVCLRILRLYARPKPRLEVLEKKVQELCKKFEENRLKNKPAFAIASGTNTPTSPSVQDKQKSSPKRRSHSDHSKSHSRSASASPRHKKSKKYRRSVTRSRSRSRSYDKKYKKSHKNNRRSRSPSLGAKAYKDKRYRSRSKSYDREYKNDGKYYSDRYREERGYDKYYSKDDKYGSKEEKYNSREDKYNSKEEKYNSKEDKYNSRDDKYISKEEKYSRKEERSNKEDDRHKSKDDKYRKSEENNKHKEVEEDERRSKHDKHSRDAKYTIEKSDKHHKEKHRSSKNSEEETYTKRDSDRKRKKHRSEEEDIADDDDIEVITIKRDKKR